jgi:predicted Zn-dependent peptidase
MNQSEVFRARNKYFNDLLQQNNSAEVASENARHAAYLDRVINRTEIATRISHMTPEYIKSVASRWFWDVETAVTAYGNLHSGMVNAHYNRMFKRATLGEYSQVSVHYQY